MTFSSCAFDFESIGLTHRKNTQVLNSNIMLNLKHTFLILATALSLGTAIFPATANAESAVCKDSNGDRSDVVEPKSGSDTVF